MLITAVFQFLLNLAGLALSWLPIHTPISWPGLGVFQVLFGWLGLFDRFVDVRSFVAILVLILGFEFALLLYTAYRAILGLIPAFK
jgi:hypothetical protein